MIHFDYPIVLMFPWWGKHPHEEYRILLPLSFFVFLGRTRVALATGKAVGVLKREAKEEMVGAYVGIS